MDIEDKGPGIQGAPKQLGLGFRGQTTERLQSLATIHSQQHGETIDGGVDFFHLPKTITNERLEEDYERNV